MNTGLLSLKLHKKLAGKISIAPKIKIRNSKDLSLVYTPGVAEVSRYLTAKPEETDKYTFKKNSVAVISDGSAVLGLGNIGPEAALPVMEGKCLLFKHFADIDAVPIVLSTQDPDEIISIVKAISPTFGGINLEDICAPKCFYIEDTLKKQLDIPVVHDDQWGAAIALSAGLINSLKLAEKSFSDVRIVVSGAGAAGTAIIRILLKQGAKNIIVCDRKGIIGKTRKDLNPCKQELANITNPDNKSGDLACAMNKSDVFIGVSSAGLVTPEMIKSMNRKAIVFAMANPVPEIMPDQAKSAGAYIVGTGRSDYPNQINNSLAFPGVFRGALDNKVKNITISMLIAAAEKLAALVKKPKPEKIIPSVFDKNVVKAVSSAIR